MLKYLKKISGVFGVKLDKKKFEETILSKWTNGCPMCGGKDWTYDNDMITTPLQLDKNMGIVLGGKIHPLVPVVCLNCGNTVFVNAKTIDALDGVKENGEP